MRHQLLQATVLLVLFSVLPAQAHRMRVFAYESGGEILTEAKFGSGRPAQNIEIRVEDSAGKVLLTGTTNTQGMSRLPLPVAAGESGIDLTIVADAGEGHRGSWLLAAEDYHLSATGDTSADIVPHTQTPPPDTLEHASGQAVEKGPPGLDYAVIEKMLQRTVAAELAPVKRQLAAERERSITLQDILGGIGYILGLAGIAAYFQAKRKGEKR